MESGGQAQGNPAVAQLDCHARRGRVSGRPVSHARRECDTNSPLSLIALDVLAAYRSGLRPPPSQREKHLQEFELLIPAIACHLEATAERFALLSSLLPPHTGRIGGRIQEPTPLRLASKDLFLRLLTKTAVLEVLADISQDSKEIKHYQCPPRPLMLTCNSSAGQWMKTFVGKWMPQFDSSVSVKVDVSFLEELLQEPFRISEKEGKMEVVDPLYISEKIFAKRLEVAGRWKKALVVAQGVFTAT
eukprot:755035-Hanusia_phi.AAC.2